MGWESESACYACALSLLFCSFLALGPRQGGKKKKRTLKISKGSEVVEEGG